ncbi:MAG: HPr(Ser) kinase/phosphatase [Deltaproteobacteria bacterium]|nr:MAG: HPr(Ser) kinase/phosphatase [Deltaproteobacteria bacterium]
MTEDDMLLFVKTGPETVSVGALLQHDGLEGFVPVHAGAEGLSRAISHPRVQKSGLALVGHFAGIVATRVQILGNTEISFLESLDAKARDERVAGLFELGLSLVVVTRGGEPLPELVVHATRTGTALVATEYRSSRSITAVHCALDELLATTTTRHGVLVDIHGVGVLLVGPSGIGKSECALFLVERGHRLVADDQVILAVTPDGHIDGRPPSLLRDHLEVRGIGILNMRDLFGATAVRRQKHVELIVELFVGREGDEYERLGIDDQSQEILGVELPMLRIPIRPGRNMGVILEVAARNHLLKQSGHHSGRRFVEDLAEELGVETPPETKR